MPLIGPKEMFKAAYDGHYAIGAFNVNNMEIIQGIMQAAADEKSPVILQVSAGARKYAGQIYIMKLVEAALTESPEVPVCVHLDHGPSFEMCKDCIDGGFTSVMIDGSALPYEENVALTKKVVDYAHPRGVWVEAELGKLAGIEEHVKSEQGISITDPGSGCRLRRKVPDATPWPSPSAPATAPTSLRAKPNSTSPALKPSAKQLPNYPLVLHGASSVPHEFVEECATSTAAT